MPRSRRQTPRLVALALLSFLLQALVPRATWYTHRHAGGGHEHVHGWDGTRVAGSTASLRDFLPHEHAEDHDADGAHRHVHHHSTGSPAETHDGHRHVDAAPVRSTPAGRTSHDTGPAFVASPDGAHAHGQAPFQIAVATGSPEVAPPRAHHACASVALASVVVASVRALRARAPPSSPV